MQISINRTANPKQKPVWDNLSFGTVFTDHMLVIDYMEGQGWHDARIMPYQDLSLSPASCVLHYGVEVFEGMKAYCTADGRILLFRPDANGRRMNDSAARLCMPELPVDDFVDAISRLVALEAGWVPQRPDMSLYIRPFMIATEAHLGVSRSSTYSFIVILSPVGAYYPEGLKPVPIYVEDEYVRAVKGGTGNIKCGGNYAAGLAAQYKAKKLGYSQVLWLDGVEQKYIDEVGTMNVLFKLKGEIVTPRLTGSILPGITRDSVLTMLRDWGLPVSERAVALDEIEEGLKDGSLEEAFGVGTAAVISPIGSLNIGGKQYTVGKGGIGEVSQRLYNSLTDIQWGRAADPHSWTLEIKAEDRS